MKTPREILRERHQRAEPGLDRVRQSVVSELFRPERPWPVLVPLKIWSELIWPARRIWAGFAVAWLAIVLVNLSESEPSTRAGANSRPAAGLFAAWERQQQLTAELLAPAERPDRPQPATVRPRSERRPARSIG